jgi:hypothetical protein
VPISWSPDKYEGDNRNYIPYYAPQTKLPEDQYYNLNNLMTFMGSDDPSYQVPNGQESLNYFPAKNMYIPVNKQKAIQEHLVPPADTGRIVPEVTFKMPKNFLYKNDLILLNIIAANNWKRPLYFTSPVTLSSIGLGDYLEADGLTYRLVPVRSTDNNNSILSAGNVNIRFMYENLMTRFKFGGAQKPGTYFDEPNRRMLLGIRNAYAKLGIALAEKGKKDSALKVLNKADQEILTTNFPYALTLPRNMHNISSLQTVYAYYLAGDSTKGDEIANEIINVCQQQLNFYNSLSPGKLGSLQSDAQSANMIISQLNQWKQMFGKQSGRSKELPELMDTMPGKRDSGKNTGK